MSVKKINKILIGTHNKGKFKEISDLLPKTVEKIVEKEVKVEKIVEKPVVEEKIVYQKVEVPKEVVKKELVHVPLWTQDTELIGKKIDLTETEIKPKKKR